MSRAGSPVAGSGKPRAINSGSTAAPVFPILRMNNQKGGSDTHPSAIKEALYRVAQEAMHNAAKHARASRIDLMLTSEPAGLVLGARDNGVGFDPHQDFAGHLGLHSMRERIKGIGGTIDIASAPGVGTKIRIVAVTHHGA